MASIRFLLVVVSATRALGLFWPLTSTTASLIQDESPPFSCGAQLRLPSNYEANFTIGKPQEFEPDVDDLRKLGFEIEYMFSHEAAADKSGSSLGAKFRNFRKYNVEMYWDDGTTPGMFSGMIKAIGRSATTTYAGHAFKIVNPSTKELITRLVMRSDTTMYFVEPEPNDSKTLSSPAYLEAKAEAEWYRNYYTTHGIPWLSMHNRPKPVLNMWPAEQVGQTHVIMSKHRFWLSPTAQAESDVELKLTVVSKAPSGPRVFLVTGLMSEYECDYIVEQGQMVVTPSAVGSEGGFKSSTRTSENGWLRRSRSPILETMHRRFADALGLDEAIVHSGMSAEELQVVRYEPGQQYQPHHDFSDTGIVNQRFLTLLLYISPPEQGGYTSFPKASNGRGLRVKPPKGSGVLFYSMLPDGNGDDLSIHAGEPVVVGRKWVCNLWIWDPKR